MFVITGGMQKSGSTLLHVYAIDLVGYAYGPGGQAAFEHWIRTGPVGGSGSFPWGGWTDHLDELAALAEEEGPFVLKTHAPFTDLLGPLAGRDVRLACSCRDPRDALLSALDHGARSRAAGDWPYAECVDVAGTLSLVESWCTDALSWVDAPGVARFRYEDLVADPATAVRRLAEHLGIDDPVTAADAAIARERAGRAPGRNQFNTGRVRRWPDELSPADLARCEAVLGAAITGLGYHLEDG